MDVIRCHILSISGALYGHLAGNCTVRLLRKITAVSLDHQSYLKIALKQEMFLVVSKIKTGDALRKGTPLKKQNCNTALPYENVISGSGRNTALFHVSDLFRTAS